MANQQFSKNASKNVNKTEDTADKMLVYRDKKIISPYYDMNNKYRGDALIFNHATFERDPDENKSKKLRERTGTHADCHNLRKCLEGLNFKVHVYQDLIKLDVYKKLKEFSKKDHSKNDCFLVAVLTHGDLGKLYAYDGDYKCEDLWSPFYKSHCPSLDGKPKIFIVQACQGMLFDHGVTLDRNASVIDNHAVNSNNMVVDFLSYKVDKPLPNDYYFSYQPARESDFLIFFSTPPEHFSWRNVVCGSWFIQELCKELEENAYKEHLLNMVTNITRRVALDYESNVPDQEKRNKMKQVPFAINTLLKICKFEEKRNFFGLKFKRNKID